MTIPLRHCVREAQHGNHEAILFLLREFEPLIRKYVKRYYVYYDSLEEAISTAQHAVVTCVFAFDLTKADYIQRKILAAVHNAFEYESYRKQCYWKRVQKTSSNRISSPIFHITGLRRKKKRRNTVY